MFKTLKILGLLVLAAIVILFGYGATRPDEFRITRKVSIKAPPDAIYSRISDMRRFNEWNPFVKGDPSVKLVYSAITAGPGGSYDWDSTGQAGKGRMAITDVLPPNRVAMALQFEAPMKANNKVVFTLRPQDSNTEVTWEMTGTYGFAHKIMDVAFNFEKLIGGEFDKGLADLKSQAEAR
jgi:carbon monoxide dehydrogenase subunit G